MVTTQIERGNATVDGLRIAYDSLGTGTPAVVFVHGIFADRGYFAAQRDHLAPGHRVISIDLRGHGDSDRPDAVSVEAFARDVEAVLGSAGVTRAVLCGHSMAGGVALDIAARRPALVAGVVMLDGVIFFPEPIRRGAVDGLLPALAGEHWSQALRDYFGLLIAPASPEVASRVMRDIGAARREIALSFFDSIFGVEYPARQKGYEQALTNLRCPLMYVRGKSPADVQKLVALKSDAMIGQVVESGHWVMLSAADQVDAMLDRFLDRVDQRP